MQEESPSIQSSPDILYKYRSWKDRNHQRLLTDNEVFLPSPEHFNDPFDCRIPRSYDKGSEQDHRAMFLRHAPAQFPLETSSEWEARADEYVQSGKWKKSEEIEFVKKSWWEWTRGYFGILSLSAVPDNILMWSHYADSHQGFCVGFRRALLADFGDDTYERNGLLTELHEVRYVSEYPFFDGFKQDDQETVKALCTKSADWAYEKEFRLVLIKQTDRSVKLDEGMLTEVILGCDICDNDRDEVVAVLRKRGDGLPLFQAQKKEDMFGLSFEPLEY